MVRGNRTGRHSAFDGECHPLAGLRGDFRREVAAPGQVRPGCGE